mgnify:CR=1 FL=1
MHIPENYLSPSTCAVMTAAAIPAWTYSIKKVKKEITKDKMPLLGIFAAFSFVAMMFNIPLVGGTTGHAVGGTLIAILLGPEAACLSVSVTLILQALLFGDGGVLAIGANCFNMAFVLPFVGYSVYSLLHRRLKGKYSRYISAAIGSYVGINAAALLAAIEFGLQPLLFRSAEGQPLYCPYGLGVAIPSMLVGHLTIFGLAEVVFTVAVLAFVNSAAPEMAQNAPATKKGTTRVGILLAVLICATPLGLLAAGTAWGEWGTDELQALLGYVPQGIEHGSLSGFEALFPDYSIGAIPEWAGYILSAIIGISLAVILFKLISTFMKKQVNYD